MKYLLCFIAGVFIGVFFGVTIMCILNVGNYEEKR